MPHRSAGGGEWGITLIGALVLSLSKKVDIGMAGCLENMSLENVVLWLQERNFLEDVIQSFKGKYEYIFNAL